MKLIIALLAINAANCNSFLFSEFLNKTPALETSTSKKAHKSLGLPNFLFSKINFDGMLQEFTQIRKNKLQSKITTDVSIVKEEQIAPFGSQYDKCLDNLETVLHNIVKCAKLCLDGKCEDTIPIMGESVQYLIKSVKCFLHPQETPLVSFDPKCLDEHLVQEVLLIMQLIADLMYKNYDEVIDDLKDIWAIAVEMIHC